MVVFSTPLDFSVRYHSHTNLGHRFCIRGLEISSIVAIMRPFFFACLYGAQLVVANTVSCNEDNCLRAVQGELLDGFHPPSHYHPNESIASVFTTRHGSADCSSFFSKTVTPATVYLPSLHFPYAFTKFASAPLQQLPRPPFMQPARKGTPSQPLWKSAKQPSPQLPSPRTLPHAQAQPAIPALAPASALSRLPKP